MSKSVEESQKKFYQANMQLGQALYYIFTEFRKEFGEKKAEEVMSRGMYKFGKDGARGQAFPQDMEVFKDLMFNESSDNEILYGPEILHSDSEVLDVRMHRCAVREGWKSAGASGGDDTKMCVIADCWTYGTLDDNYEVSTDYPKAEDDLCVYHFRLKKKS